METEANWPGSWPGCAPFFSASATTCAAGHRLHNFEISERVLGLSGEAAERAASLSRALRRRLRDCEQVLWATESNTYFRILWQALEEAVWIFALMKEIAHN